MAKRAAMAMAAAALIASVTMVFALYLYDRQSAPTIVIEDADENAEIVVSVEGAVNAPGVYRLTGNARLVDALAAASGLSGDADVSQINMAKRLEDEERIVIPSMSVAVTVSPTIEVAGIRAESGRNEPIDINTADIATLDTLPGIGPVLAERIVTYRDANGPFTRIEELARVDGISQAMVDELRDRITVGS